MPINLIGNFVSFEKPKRSPSIYFIRDGRAIKIGIASDPENRLSGLQVGNPRQLKLLGSFKGTAFDESCLHRQFGRYCIRGEWFRDHPELRETIRNRCVSKTP